MPFECTASHKVTWKMRPLNNTMVSYVFFNFLYGKSVLHKESIGKMWKSWFIPYLHSFWYLEMNQSQSMPEKKLVKSFRKLIFPWQKDKLPWESLALQYKTPSSLMRAVLLNYLKPQREGQSEEIVFLIFLNTTYPASCPPIWRVTTIQIQTFLIWDLNRLGHLAQNASNS